MSYDQLPLPNLLQAPLRSRPPHDIKEKSGDTSPLLRQTGHCSLPTQVTFVWNNQKCHGSQFHLDVLNGDLDAMERQLDQGASVSAEFHYRSSHSQSLTYGQPIHLAASRGHELVILLLLSHGASPRQSLLLGINLLIPTRVLRAHLYSDVFQKGVGKFT